MPRYTQAQLAAVRKGVLALLGGDIPRAGYGVCYNLSRHLDVAYVSTKVAHVDGYTFVQDAAQGWPHALRHDDGGAKEYFVAHTDGYGNWEGPNLERRKSLLQYLLGVVAHHEAMLRGGVALAG